MKKSVNLVYNKNYLIHCVVFVTDNDLFRKALFENYRIRDCSVRLNRNLPNPNRKLQLAPEGSIRSKAICFPTTSSVHENSSESLNSLATYRQEHALVPFGKKKNVNQLRAKSMFAVRTTSDEETNGDNGKQYSLQDLNSEFHLKFSGPNHGLNPTRINQQKPQQPLSPWQIIQNDFRNKIQAENLEKHSSK